MTWNHANAVMNLLGKMFHRIKQVKMRKMLSQWERVDLDQQSMAIVLKRRRMKEEDVNQA